MSTTVNQIVAAQIAQEQAHVDRVYTELAKARERIELVHAEGMARARTDRAGTGDPREEEIVGLFERDALVYSASQRRASLDYQHEGLVFGRLDLDHSTSTANTTAESASKSASNGADDAGATADPDHRETRYIGRLGVRDDDYEPLVIDWRAPAAAPFYRATPVDPLGVIRRRVLRCRGEQVVGVEDDLMVIEAPEDIVVVGDGALMAALTRSRGGTMRDIVATIQRHQDEAIRAPARGVTEITGGPGTGKTVVALHRAAYLLYSDRRKFESGGILVVGPSSAYTAYIERVLPSLGEDSVVLRSLGDLVAGVSARRLDSPEIAAIKGSLRIRRVLSRVVREPIPDAPELLRVFVAGHAVRLESGDLARVRRQVLRHHHRNTSWGTALRELAETAWARVRQGEKEEFVDRFVDSGDVEAFARQWWRPLDPREVLLWLADRDRLARLSQGVFSGAEVALLAESYAEALRTGEWSVADVALLDDLSVRLGPLTELPSEERGFYEIEELDDVSQYGVSALRGEQIEEHRSRGSSRSQRLSADPRERLMAGSLHDSDSGAGDDEYAHVLVDEAQDLSPMQWRMLGRRGAWASWTVVGDAAQSSWPDEAEAARAREEAFGTAPRRSFHMSTNYRNAREIFRYAERLIRQHVPDADIPEAVRETGHEPVISTGSVESVLERATAAVEELAGQVPGPIAIIAPDSRAEPLADLHGSLDGRVLVIDPISTKGLEWDATVVVDPDEIVRTAPGGARALYVALTRAAHRMAVLDVGP